MQYLNVHCRNLPAQMVRERQSGLSMVRFLTSISKSIEETSTEIFPILSGMADLILKQENLRGIALNVGEDHVENLAQQTDKFVNSLPMSMSGEERNQVGITRICVRPLKSFNGILVYSDLIVWRTTIFAKDLRLFSFPCSLQWLGHPDCPVRPRR